jgi:cell division septation protein DedD
MEETTWKGHTFTLLVFTGIVVLCSIFFILGMLVGRAQGQKIASNATTTAPPKVVAKPEPKEEKPDFTFDEAVKKPEPAAALPSPRPTLDPLPVPETAAKSESSPQPEGSETISKPANVLNYQIGAVRTSSDAERLLEDVKKKGFHGFILAPPPDDPNPYYRVQVGPIADPIEAQELKKKLEAAGYRVLPKK